VSGAASKESEQEGSWVDALRHRGGACCRALCKSRSAPDCRSKASDEWISFILHIKFEAFG
jgi:hypothetical protein